jgi:hypothetical protein
MRIARRGMQNDFAVDEFGLGLFVHVGIKALTPAGFGLQMGNQFRGDFRQKRAVARRIEIFSD